jgi:hypothetical protein
MLTAVGVKVLPVCFVDAIEFTFVCFCIELRHLPVRQKYNSLETLYEFCSLPCSVLSVSSECVFPILVALACL